MRPMRRFIGGAPGAALVLRVLAGELRREAFKVRPYEPGYRVIRAALET